MLAVGVVEPADRMADPIAGREPFEPVQSLLGGEGDRETEETRDRETEREGLRDGHGGLLVCRTGNRNAPFVVPARSPFREKPFTLRSSIRKT